VFEGQAMKRFFLLGSLLVNAAAGFAADPLSVYPGTTVKTAESATPSTVLTPAVSSPTSSTPLAMPSTLSQPLSRILGSAASPATQQPSMPVSYPMNGMIAPTVPVSAYQTAGCETGTCAANCDVPLFPTAGGSGRPRPALDRLIDWLSYRPGPSQLPILVPVPYSAPLRAYFPCRDPGSCGGTAGPSGSGSGYGGGLGSRFGSAGMGIGSCNTVDGSCKDRVCNAPIPKGFGAFAKPSGYCPTAGSLGVGCAPIAVPLPASCVGTMGCVAGCRQSRGNAFARLFGCFSSTTHGCSSGGCAGVAGDPNWQPPTATVPMIMGYTFPTQGQYRFAHPTTHPSLLQNQHQQPLPFAPALPAGTVVPIDDRQQNRSANQPFTRQ